MTANDCGAKVAAALSAMGKTVDVLINNAGYFYEPVEKVHTYTITHVHTTNTTLQHSLPHSSTLHHSLPLSTILYHSLPQSTTTPLD
jgi:short-subunit dehydrogenase